MSDTPRKDGPRTEARNRNVSWRWGDDLGRMLRLIGGRIRFFGLTVGKYGFGIIRWRPLPPRAEEIMTERDTPVTALLAAANDELPALLADAHFWGRERDIGRVMDVVLPWLEARLASSDDVAGSGERLDWFVGYNAALLDAKDGTDRRLIEARRIRDAAPTTQAPREDGADA
jgi:hypothetical protein